MNVDLLKEFYSHSQTTPAKYRAWFSNWQESNSVSLSNANVEWTYVIERLADNARYAYDKPTGGFEQAKAWADIALFIFEKIKQNTFGFDRCLLPPYDQTAFGSPHIRLMDQIHWIRCGVICHCPPDIVLEPEYSPDHLLKWVRICITWKDEEWETLCKLSNALDLIPREDLRQWLWRMQLVEELVNCQRIAKTAEIQKWIKFYSVIKANLIK